MKIAIKEAPRRSGKSTKCIKRMVRYIGTNQSVLYLVPNLRILNYTLGSYFKNGHYDVFNNIDFEVLGEVGGKNKKWDHLIADEISPYYLDIYEPKIKKSIYCTYTDRDNETVLHKGVVYPYEEFERKFCVKE